MNCDVPHEEFEFLVNGCMEWCENRTDHVKRVQHLTSSNILFCISKHKTAEPLAPTDRNQTWNCPVNVALMDSNPIARGDNDWDFL